MPVTIPGRKEPKKAPGSGPVNHAAKVHMRITMRGLRELPMSVAEGERPPEAPSIRERCTGDMDRNGHFVQHP